MRSSRFVLRAPACCSRARSRRSAAVQVHRALGLAGGAGGVDQDREVFGLASRRCAARVHAGCAARWSRPSSRSASRLITIGSSQVATGPPCRTRRSLRSSGSRGAHFERLVELLVVLDEQHGGARVFAQVLRLRRRIGRIDAVGDAAARQHRQIGQHPFDHGVGQDRCASRPRSKPSAIRPCAISRTACGGLVPAPAAPDAEFLLAHPHAIAARCATAFQNIAGTVSPGTPSDPRSMNLLEVPEVRHQGSGGRAAC